MSEPALFPKKDTPETRKRRAHKKDSFLSVEKLRETLNYDPETGIFVWKKNRRKTSIGNSAGSMNLQGYIRIGIDVYEYLAHRLAWLYMTGEWPKKEIDHINGKRNDNRWINLRDVPHFMNIENVRKARKHNAYGVLGAYFERHHAPKPWHARFKINGKLKSLGHFATPEEAHEAYLKAKRQFHQGCTI